MTAGVPATTTRIGRRPGVDVATLGLVASGAVAWAGTIVWARGMDMPVSPGTMGLGAAAFVAVWGLMMAAMMLPSVAPLASLYARTVTGNRGARLGAFAAGYVLVWTASGVGGFALAAAFGAAANSSPGLARGLAVAAFASCGVYQLTPLKDLCLRHCRTPLGHLVHYLSFTGRTRDLRVGAHHGVICLGCCWALMVVLVALGVMNLLAMAALALVIALEKRWRHGPAFARVVGVAALVYAVAVAVVPGLAPGLDPGAVPTSRMGDMGM